MDGQLSRSDIISAVILVAIMVPLSIWGGYKHWGGETDLLPLFMLGAVGLYLIVQGLRLGSPQFGVAVGGMAIISAFAPSLLIDTSQFRRKEDLIGMLIVLLASIAMGAGVAALGRKFDMPQKLRTMPANTKIRIWGLSCPAGAPRIALGHFGLAPSGTRHLPSCL